MSSKARLVIILDVATLAQMAEQFIRNEQVKGSSPLGGFFSASEKSGVFFSSQTAQDQQLFLDFNEKTLVFMLRIFIMYIV